MPLVCGGGGKYSLKRIQKIHFYNKSLYKLCDLFYNKSFYKLCDLAQHNKNAKFCDSQNARFYNLQNTRIHRNKDAKFYNSQSTRIYNSKSTRFSKSAPQILHFSITKSVRHPNNSRDAHRFTQFIA